MAKAWHDLRESAGHGLLPVAAREGREIPVAEHPVADWRKRICDHIAYALLVYTGLQIMLTMNALRLKQGGALPYLALLVLVGAVIPACRALERRWTRLTEAEASDPAREADFRRDRMMVWAGALGLPCLLTAVFSLIS